MLSLPLQPIVVDTFSNSILIILLRFIVATKVEICYKCNKVFPFNFIACLLFSGVLFSFLVVVVVASHTLSFSRKLKRRGGDIHFGCRHRRIFPFHFLYTFSPLNYFELWRICQQHHVSVYTFSLLASPMLKGIFFLKANNVWAIK